VIRMQRALWIPFLAAVVAWGCGENQTASDDLPPSQPVWVTRSADDVYPQRGIRAYPAISDAQHWVILEWYANPEPDVNRYVVVRSPEEFGPQRGFAVADLQIGVDIEAGRAEYTWVDVGDSVGGVPRDMLAPNPESGYSRGYYWRILAYDTAGNRSPQSDPVYYRLINNPYDLSVQRDTTDLYALNWSYVFNPDVVLSFYMIRVYTEAGGPDSVVWWQQIIRYGTSETAYLDFSQSLGPLHAGQTYVCQLNAISTRQSEGHADSLAGAAMMTRFTYRN
jgi:hypothetical protein